jgi:hypothetical protein
LPFFGLSYLLVYPFVLIFPIIEEARLLGLAAHWDGTWLAYFWISIVTVYIITFGLRCALCLSPYCKRTVCKRTVRTLLSTGACALYFSTCVLARGAQACGLCGCAASQLLTCASSAYVSCSGHAELLAERCSGQAAYVALVRLHTT